MDYTHPTEEFLRSIDIHTLLPQQEPFVMVCELAHYDDLQVKTRLRVTDENIFTVNGQFATAGMIENIAQTCAVRIGYVNKYILKKGIQIGVIAAVRDLKIMGHPKAGSAIETTVTVKAEVMGMTLADAKIEEDGKVLATSQVKLSVSETK